jgi:excinuclease ABC subunit A
LRRSISIKHASMNNLKNITVDIPRNKLVVVTGVSGSGKSTLIFETLYQESQRQFLDAQGVVTTELQRPRRGTIEGLSPSIAVDQHLVNHNPRSTVGTMTGIYTYLRILYSRIGYRPCLQCGQDVPPPDIDGSWETEEYTDEVSAASEYYPCPYCGEKLLRLNQDYFSFNKPEGACPNCLGLGITRKPHIEQIIDAGKSILEGGVVVWHPSVISQYLKTLKNAEKQYSGLVIDPSRPLSELNAAQKAFLLYGNRSQQFQELYAHTSDYPANPKVTFEGVVPNLLRRYEEHADDLDYRAEMEKFLIMDTCYLCNGDRLRPEALAVKVGQVSLASLVKMPLKDLVHWLLTLPASLSLPELQLVEPLLQALKEHVLRLVHVGLDYLTLHRDFPGLSTGEAQRIRLASLLTSGLTNVIYILDEPTVGLHERDIVKLIGTLMNLRDLENTIIVIEHHLEVIRAADYIIEIGPGAGEHGGQVVALGKQEEIMACEASLTGSYLSERRQLPLRNGRTPSAERVLTIKGGKAHNLKNIDVTFPLHHFIAVTGVSGAGKSTLVFDILGRAASRHFSQAKEVPGEHDAIEGWQYIDKTIILDQEPFSRMKRSNAATYTGIFGLIRQVFAATPDAARLRVAARDFSCNVPGGRCEHCEGAGVISVPMYFLPPSTVTCPVCRGRRFKPQVLEVKYQGYDIASVLDMTVEKALQIFSDTPGIAGKLALLAEIGLGYLPLGQPAPTLSGGEAQRIKLATELARHPTGKTLYILDEPTTGLHIDDTARLLPVLHKLVDAGNTVIVIEHDLDVIKSADWVIDLGPEGGIGGGQIVAQGTPLQIAQSESGSHTGLALRKVLFR